MQAAAAWALIRRFWWVLPLVLSALWGWRMDSLRARHLRDLHQLEANYKAAQSEALAKALAANWQQEQESRDRANETDRKEQAARADGYAAAERYIDTHRVRACPAPGASSGTAAAAQGDSAQGADRSGDSAVVVAEDDVNICTSNSLRLQAAHDWALRL